jgi:hypothetical protein
MITSKRKCPSCGGTDFAEGEFRWNTLRLRGEWNLWGMGMRHPMKAAVCVDCGYVHHYLNGPDLDDIRKKARGSVADRR